MDQNCLCSNVFIAGMNHLLKITLILLTPTEEGLWLEYHLQEVEIITGQK